MSYQLQSRGTRSPVIFLIVANALAKAKFGCLASVTMAVYHVLNCPCYAVSFLIGLCLTTTFSGITFAFQEDELDDSFEGEDIIDIGSLEEHLKTTPAESARDEEKSENESSSSHIPSLHTPYCTGSPFVLGVDERTLVLTFASRDVFRILWLWRSDSTSSRLSGGYHENCRRNVAN